MGEVGLREAFDAWVPEAAPLRSLAGEIATLRATEAVAFLSRVGCEPFNILANAQLASDWSLPVAHSSKTLLRWKRTPAHLHGFRGRKAVPARGLDGVAKLRPGRPQLAWASRHSLGAGGSVQGFLEGV